MSYSPLTKELIDTLKCLPGVGTKTAQRMAMSLLMRQREAGLKLAIALEAALSKVGTCELCRNFSETALCFLCTSHSRHAYELCIVESPIDLMAIEQAGHFKGRYFVLQGHLSPLDGVGPKELKLDQLETHLDNPEIIEVILAINPTVEGQATCHYLIDMAKTKGKQVSQIAYGVPFGGELEWVDVTTLSHAFQTRQIINS